MGLVAIILAVILFVPKAGANQLYFPPTIQTDTATTTVQSVSGVVTFNTTPLDSYNTIPGIALNGATLLVRQVASTSAAITKIEVQYSQDGVDWFENNLSATSTLGNIQEITTAKTYQITGNTTASSTFKAIGLETPTRYVRAKFSAVAGTSTVWYQFVPRREFSK